MRTFLFIVSLLALPALAQNLTVTVPAGCIATPASVAVTCGTTPPPVVCPPGTTGTPPNCAPIPPPTSSACPGFPSTLQGTLPWTPPFSTFISSENGGFAAKGAMVIKFTTPATKPTGSGNGRIDLSEYLGPPAVRAGSLSTTPCDFVGGIDGKGVFANNTSVSVSFSFTSQPPGKGGGGIELQPSTTYYLNVHNPLGCSPGPTCDVKVTLTLPK